MASDVIPFTKSTADTKSMVAATLHSLFVDDINHSSDTAALLGAAAVSKHVYNIAALQRLPHLNMRLTDEVFVCLVVESLRTYPTLHIQVLPDQQHIRRLHIAKQISQAVDCIFMDEGPVPASERALVRSCISREDNAIPVQTLYETSVSVRSLARTSQQITEALYHNPPIFAHLKRGGKMIIGVSLENALERQLDSYFSYTRLKYDRFLTEHLTSNGNRIALSFLVTFPRLQRILAQFPAGTDGINATRAALRRKCSDNVELDADDNYARVTDASTRILRLIDFYFGESNYPRDIYLLRLAEEGGEGFVRLSDLCAFPRMSRLHATPTLVSELLQKHPSAVVEVSSDGESVRRKGQAAGGAGDGVHAFIDDSLLAILKQVEFYFHDQNYAKDLFLRSLEDTNGYIPLARLCTFRRLTALHATPSLVAQAASKLGSELVILNQDETKIAKRQLGATKTSAAPIRAVQTSEEAAAVVQALLTELLSPHHFVHDGPLQALFLEERDMLPPGSPLLAFPLVSRADALVAHAGSYEHDGFSRESITHRISALAELPLSGWESAILSGDCCIKSIASDEGVFIVRTEPIILPRRIVQVRKADHHRSFSMMTYNVLADVLCSDEVYSYTDPTARQWPERRDRIVREILKHSPSILCLQEVQGTRLGWGSSAFEQNHAAWFRECLAKYGYDGCYRVAQFDSRLKRKSTMWPRIGVTLFWKEDVWEPLPNGVRRINYSTCMYEACGTDTYARSALCLWQGAVVACLVHKSTGQVAVFASTHISCRWQQPYVQIMQMHSLVREIEKMLGPALVGRVPVIIGGDFNIQPDGGAYALMTAGKLSRDHHHVRSAFCPADGSKGVNLPYPEPTHILPLRSTYAGALGKELDFTNYALRKDDVFSGTLDYMFYTPGPIKPTAVLDGISTEIASAEAALPSRMFPSDHLPLYAEYELGPQESALRDAVLTRLQEQPPADPLDLVVG